jgi:hypothetical protein
MARVKLERQVMGEFHDFDKDPKVEGRVLEVREINTKFGAGNVIDLQGKDDQKITIMQTAGLKGFNFATDLKGQYVYIEATGYQKGSNGIFRSFDVYVDDTPI